MVKRLLAPVTLAGLLLASAVPSSAGGSWLYPVEDRIDPGDEVTYVGYVSNGQLGWVDDGPFYAYLRVDPLPVDNTAGFPSIAEGDRPLGQLAVEEWGEPGFNARVAITFVVPEDLSPGMYSLVYCNEPCTQGFGDLIGAEVFVGVDAAFGCRPWSVDEPRIPDLAPDALVCHDDRDLTAAEILAGAPFVDPTEPQPPLAGGPDELGEAEALEILGIESRAELERIRSILAQERINNSAIADLLARDQAVLVTRRSDDGPSPYLLATVVVGLLALSAVTVGVVQRRAASG